MSPDRRSLLRVLLLAAGLALPLAASEVWTVPVKAEPAVLTAPGFVIADRGGLTALKAPGERSVLIWVAGHGQVVQAGESVAIYDTSAIARQVAVRRGELAWAEASLTAVRLESAKAQAELQERRQTLTAELASVRARRAALGSDAQSRQALAQGRLALADLALADRERSTARIRASADAGAAAAEDARRAEADIAIARLQGLAQRADDRKTEEDLDPSITATRLASQEANLLLRLGLTADDQPDPRRGLTARLALGADTGGIAWWESERDTRRRQLHDSERDSADHTPVQWIELTPAAGGPPRRFDLSVLARDGQGFGWEEPVQIQDPAKPVVVVAGQRRWRAQVAPGTWRIAIGLGDQVDWDGALVQVLRPAFPALTLHASTRLEAKATVTASQEVAINDGLLILAFGGGDDGPARRTIRAPVAGTVLLQPETQRGMRLVRGFRTLGYLAGAAAVQVAARIPLGEAVLYGTGTGTDKAKDPLEGIARGDVGILLPNGDLRPAKVLTVGTKPVSRRATLGGWDESEDATPQDLIASEMTLGLAQPVPLRTAVTVRALLTPPEGWVAVPPHLVGRRDRLAWLRSPGGPARQVTARRCGPVELVQGLHPGDRLEIPGAPPANAGNAAAGEAPADGLETTDDAPRSQPALPTNGFLGEVIALERERVVVPQIWGLVQELIPDGTDVRAGDKVLTAYSPWLDNQREQIAQDRKRAETDRALAVRERQLKALDEADRRSDQSVAGLEARANLAIATRPRPARREAALAALEVARSKGAEARRRLAAWQALATWQAPGENAAAGRPIPALASALEAAARAAAEEARAEVEAAATVEQLLPGAQATAAARRQEDLLAGRAGDAAVAAAERRAGVARAEARAIGAQDLAAWAEDFARLRVIRAPAAGRLYWATAWNEQTRTMGKVTRETMLWGGMAIAEIVDLRRLGCSFELPEDRWRSLREGLQVTVTVPSLGGLRLPGTITRIARLVEPPRDNRIIDGVQIADRRVFRVTVRLDSDAPAASGPLATPAATLQPGVKTILSLPESP